MRDYAVGFRRKHTVKRLRRRLALCETMRDNADVATRRGRLTSYSEEARTRLGEAVKDARKAMGYKWRTDFIKRYHDEINKTSLELLENGRTGVGPDMIVNVARILPGWDDDTPWKILDGADAPAVERQPEPARNARTPQIDLSKVDPLDRREVVRQTIRSLELFRQTEEAYEQYIDQAIDLAIQLGRLEAAEQASDMGESVRQAG